MIIGMEPFPIIDRCREYVATRKQWQSFNLVLYHARPFGEFDRKTRQPGIGTVGMDPIVPIDRQSKDRSLNPAMSRELNDNA